LSINTDKMDKTFFRQRVLPHIIAVSIFLVVTILFFHPVIFEGKKIQQNDINQGVGSASEIIEYREETGKEALWTNSMFSGMPAYLINLRWSGETIANTIQKIYSLYLPTSLRETFIAFLSFYILLLVFGVRWQLAIAGALAYGLNTFFLVSIEAGHIWKVRAIAYMPLVMAGIHLVFRRKWLVGLLAMSVGMTLELLSNHLQITYYLLLIVIIYGLVQLGYYIRENKLIDFGKAVGILSIGVVIAILATIGKIWTTYEYGKYSTRGKSELTSAETDNVTGLDRDYVFGWSSGTWESLTLIVPHLYGGASGRYGGKDSELSQVLRQNNVPRNQIEQYENGLLGYWGSQPFVAGPVYSSVIIAFLFVLGIFFADKKYKVWLISVFVLGLMLSWGKNFEVFNYLMYDYFPGYNKFRSVSMTIILSIFALNLLGFIGLERLLKKDSNKELLKKFFIASGTIIGLLLLIAVFANPPSIEGEQIPQAVRSAVEQDRVGIIRNDVFRSVFYVLIAIVLIYFYLKNKLSELAFTILLGGFILLDLWLIDTRYINSSNYIKPEAQEFFNPLEADLKIQEDNSIYRVLNLRDPFNDASTSHFHFSIGGYHGAKMKRYADLISHQLVDEIQGIMQTQKISPANTNMLSALNTKYLIAGTGANAAIRNQFANGNAWFVDDVKLVNSPDEEIAALDNTGLDSIAVIDNTKFKVGQENYNGSGTIELVDYKPNELTYKSSNEGEGLAVFSEIYYPVGWEATIDGQPAEILRADYVLRALQIPAGDHKIVFTFQPKSYYVGNKLVWLGNVLLLVLVVGAFFFILKDIKKPVPSE